MFDFFNAFFCHEFKLIRSFQVLIKQRIVKLWHPYFTVVVLLLIFLKSLVLFIIMHCAKGTAFSWFCEFAST